MHSITYSGRVLIASLLSLAFTTAALAQETAAECTILYPATDNPYIADTWPDGVVPYLFEGNVTADNQAAMSQAMLVIENVSIVRFVLRTTENRFLRIKDSPVNKSFIGMQQTIGQTFEINNWTKFNMVHELLHALGFWHTHQRNDRDNYVFIQWYNIQPGMSDQFIKFPGNTFGPYDFDSVMHFSSCAFTTCTPCPPSPACYTIVAVPPLLPYVSGQRTHLSEGDIASINFLYPPESDSVLWVDFLYDGPTSDGSIDEPFATLQEGLSAVESGGRIRIKPGTTSEIFPNGINQPVTIEAGDGEVTIGE